MVAIVVAVLVAEALLDVTLVNVTVAYAKLRGPSYNELKKEKVELTVAP